MTLIIQKYWVFMYINSLSTLFHHPCHSLFFDRNHLRSNIRIICGRHGGLVVSALDSWASCLGLSQIDLKNKVTCNIYTGTGKLLGWNLTNCREVTCDGLASCPGEVEILLATAMSQSWLQRIHYKDHFRSGIICHLLRIICTPVKHKWIPANCWGNLNECWQIHVAYDGLACHPPSEL